MEGKILKWARAVSMPFKRAGWLQLIDIPAWLVKAMVSMPFKRAGWLQLAGGMRPTPGTSFNAL